MEMIAARKKEFDACYTPDLTSTVDQKLSVHPLKIFSFLLFCSLHRATDKLLSVAFCSILCLAYVLLFSALDIFQSLSD